MDEKFTSLKRYTDLGARICGLPQQLVSGEVFYAIVNSDNKSLSVQKRLDQEWTAEEA